MLASVMNNRADKEPPGHIVAHNNLRLAILIRFLNDGRDQYFILEDVATRRRQRFESAEALLAQLERLFST